MKKLSDEELINLTKILKVLERAYIENNSRISIEEGVSVLIPARPMKLRRYRMIYDARHEIKFPNVLVKSNNGKIKYFSNKTVNRFKEINFNFDELSKNKNNRNAPRGQTYCYGKLDPAPNVIISDELVMTREFNEKLSQLNDEIRNLCSNKKTHLEEQIATIQQIRVNDPRLIDKLRDGIEEIHYKNTPNSKVFLSKDVLELIVNFLKYNKENDISFDGPKKDQMPINTIQKTIIKKKKVKSKDKHVTKEESKKESKKMK